MSADRFSYLHGGRAVPEVRQGPAKGHEDKPWAKGVASTSALPTVLEGLDSIVWLACQTRLILRTSKLAIGDACTP